VSSTQGCPPRVSSKVSSREDILPILFIYRKLYSLPATTIPFMAMMSNICYFIFFYVTYSIMNICRYR
jgi:hypothetical protein